MSQNEPWEEAKAFAARLYAALEGMKNITAELDTFVNDDIRRVEIEIRHKKVKSYRGGKEGSQVGTIIVRQCEGGYRHTWDRRRARLDIRLCPPWSRRGHAMPPRRQFKHLSDANYTKTLELVAQCAKHIEDHDRQDKDQQAQERHNEKWIKDWAHWIAGQIVGMEVEEVYGSRCRLKRGDVDLCVEARGEEGFSVKGSIVEIEHMSREHATFELFKACYTAERDIRKLAYGVPID